MARSRQSFKQGLALARLAIEEGHAQDAEPEARECLNQLRQQQLPDDEIGAGLVLADALLNLSKNVDAKKELVVLRPVQGKTQNRELQLRFSLEFARVLPAEPDLNASRTLLGSVAKEAEAGGFASLDWEAKTVLAMLQGEGGDVAGATKQLKLIEVRVRYAGLPSASRPAKQTQLQDCGAAQVDSFMLPRNLWNARQILYRYSNRRQTRADLSNFPKLGPDVVEIVAVRERQRLCSRVRRRVVAAVVAGRQVDCHVINQGARLEGTRRRDEAIVDFAVKQFHRIPRVVQRFQVHLLFARRAGRPRRASNPRRNREQNGAVVDLKDWPVMGLSSFWSALDPTDAPLLLRDVETDNIYALTLEEK